MREKDIEDLKRVKTISKNLKCPHCKQGTQIEDRNCIQGYIQYKCFNCGYVESYGDHFYRAINEAINSEVKE